jgi:serine phosphatase RsbU (regulator of sigma subunit)
MLWQSTLCLYAGKGERVQLYNVSGNVALSSTDFFASSSVVSDNTNRSQATAAPTLALPEYWRFRAGDNPLFALPEYDDSSWDTCSTLLVMTPAVQRVWSNGDNNGVSSVGWFRLHITIDSALRYQTVALLLFQRGASEVYVNGRKLYSVGRVSANATIEERVAMSTPIPLQFGGETRYVLAVRYSNTAAVTLASRYGNFGKIAGFECVLKPLEQAVADMQAVHTMAVGNLIALGVVSGLTLLHLLFFLYYPKQRVHLFYSFFTGILAVRFWVVYAESMPSNPDLLPMLAIAPIFYSTALIGFHATFLYSTFYTVLPRTLWITVAACIVFSLLLFYSFQGVFFEKSVVSELWQPFMIVFSLDGLRICIKAIREKKRDAWILLIGTLDFAAMWIFRWTQGFLHLMVPPQVYETVLYVGYMSIPFAMSFYIARSISSTSRSLTTQMSELQELSKKSSEQERRAKEQELRQRLLQADNDRKTRELEEARALQLSMLPRTVPEHPRFHIATYMRTATEVGGDYYDFKVEPDGTLLAAVGDATGHGMKAGFLVSTAKSYVQTLNTLELTGDALQRISAGIRNMNLRGMYMCLMLVKLFYNRAVVAVAGMPPVLVFRASTGLVERITIKALPLGSVGTFPYQEHTLLLSDGDVLLLMSDGLPELFNAHQEMLGDERIEGRFQSVAEQSPEAVIAALRALIDEWSEGGVVHDDITIVVIKVKPVHSVAAESATTSVETSTQSQNGRGMIHVLQGSMTGSYDELSMPNMPNVVGSHRESE